MTDELAEPFAVADIYVDGLAEVEHLGGDNFRFIFFSFAHGEKVVAAKLVSHATAVPPATATAMAAVVEHQISRCFRTLRMAGLRH